MLIFSHQLRVRFADTDQMGVVYYGNYACFLEAARVEMLRDLGISYLDIEKMGIILPVTNFRIKYLAPALYDDLLTIETKLERRPPYKILFKYKIYNQKKIFLSIAETELIFLDKNTKKICIPPENILKLLSS